MYYLSYNEIKEVLQKAEEQYIHRIKSSETHDGKKIQHQRGFCHKKYKKPTI